jgi:hypothetical protein
MGGEVSDDWEPIPDVDILGSRCACSDMKSKVAVSKNVTCSNRTCIAFYTANGSHYLTMYNANSSDLV